MTHGLNSAIFKLVIECDSNNVNDGLSHGSCLNWQIHGLFGKG